MHLVERVLQHAHLPNIPGLFSVKRYICVELEGMMYLCGMIIGGTLLCSLGFIEDKLDAVLKVLALDPKVSLVVHLSRKKHTFQLKIGSSSQS